MLKYIIFSMLSFLLGIFAGQIIELLKQKKKYNKVKPLNEQDFKKAMKDLEIK